VVEAHRNAGKWKNYPDSAKLAEDGDAVRILGAYLGNGVEEADVWTTRLAKVDTAMARWKRSHATMGGKKHVAQMIVGSMTQFLADVQRMPEAVTKRLTKMIRDYLWDDRKHTPVAMEYLLLPKNQGGL
ncbi:hypothetical protein C2E23DRAFT_689008, partial [Lenzites betulinus]